MALVLRPAPLHSISDLAWFGVRLGCGASEAFDSTSGDTTCNPTYLGICCFHQTHARRHHAVMSVRWLNLVTARARVQAPLRKICMFYPAAYHACPILRYQGHGWGRKLIYIRHSFMHTSCKNKRSTGKGAPVERDLRQQRRGRARRVAAALRGVDHAGELFGEHVVPDAIRGRHHHVPGRDLHRAQLHRRMRSCLIMHCNWNTGHGVHSREEEEEERTRLSAPFTVSVAGTAVLVAASFAVLSCKTVRMHAASIHMGVIEAEEGKLSD